MLKSVDQLNPCLDISDVIEILDKAKSNMDSELCFYMLLREANSKISEIIKDALNKG
jgi:hypothetical protein